MWIALKGDWMNPYIRPLVAAGPERERERSAPVAKVALPLYIRHWGVWESGYRCPPFLVVDSPMAIMAGHSVNRMVNYVAWSSRAPLGFIGSQLRGYREGHMIHTAPIPCYLFPSIWYLKKLLHSALLAQLDPLGGRSLGNLQVFLTFNNYPLFCAVKLLLTYLFIYLVWLDLQYSIYHPSNQWSLGLVYKQRRTYGDPSLFFMYRMWDVEWELHHIRHPTSFHGQSGILKEVSWFPVRCFIHYTTPARFNEQLGNWNSLSSCWNEQGQIQQFCFLWRSTRWPLQSI